jgi:hypothetical protein
VKTKEEKDEMSCAILTPATTLVERKSATNDNTNGQQDMDRENITTPFVEYIPETFKTKDNSAGIVCHDLYNVGLSWTQIGVFYGSSRSILLHVILYI